MSPFAPRKDSPRDKKGTERYKVRQVAKQGRAADIASVLAPRSSGKENHLNVKPFVETLRVTNPVRQSRASSREASLAWGRVTATAKRRQQDQTLCD